MSKKNKEKESWLLTKTFYAVVFSLVLAIVGVASAIYNVARVKDLGNDVTGQYTAPKSTTDYQANANKKGVPDTRESTTTQPTTTEDLNRPYSGYFLLPVKGKVIKDFSDENPVYSKTLGDWRCHNGIDVSASIGDNAIAVQDGIVTDVYSDELWGEVIVIEHGGGMAVKYCGIKPSVSKDEKVEQGQVIGTVVIIPVEANDGVHIHLETDVNGKFVNPVNSLNLLKDNKNTTE